MTHLDEPSRKPRYVRVPGRDDVGEVVVNGKNFGNDPGVYCVGVHFTSTGECAYYDSRRVTNVDTP